MSTTRPIVKRTYGSRKTNTHSTPSTTSSSSSPLRSTTLSSSSTSGWEAALQEEEEEREREGICLTPPTSPRPSSSSSSGPSQRITLRDSSNQKKKKKRSISPPGTDLGRPEELKGKEKKLVGGGGDLRNFFDRASPPKARKMRRLSFLTSQEEQEGGKEEDSRQSIGSNTKNTTFSFSSSYSSSSSKRKQPQELSQLYLDPFTSSSNSGHSTLHCSICSLSYSRTPQDLDFHTKHHKKIVSGIDWTNSGGITTIKGVTLLQDEIEIKGKGKGKGKGKDDLKGGKVLMCDWSIVENPIKKRLREVMETIDTELSSTNLTEDQLCQSKLFLFVNGRHGKKVIACAVVQRIQEAFKVVVSTTPTKATMNQKKEEEEEEKVEGLIKFGEEEEDSGAIFCSPTPLPTLLGIHRIWTSTSFRRNGLASILLDHVGERFLYGCPIAKERRKEDVAFSQPTGKGKELAKRWTNTNEFKVFVD